MKNLPLTIMRLISPLLLPVVLVLCNMNRASSELWNNNKNNNNNDRRIDFIQSMKALEQNRHVSSNGNKNNHNIDNQEEEQQQQQKLQHILLTAATRIESGLYPTSNRVMMDVHDPDQSSFLRNRQLKNRNKYYDNDSSTDDEVMMEQLQASYNSSSSNNKRYNSADLTMMALKYIGCRNVHSWSNDTFSSLQNVDRFVIFRLCDANACSSYNKWGCNSNYGEYILPMERYLQIMNNYYTNDLGKYCNVCSSCISFNEDVECVPDSDYYGYGDDYYNTQFDDDYRHSYSSGGSSSSGSSSSSSSGSSSSSSGSSSSSSGSSSSSSSSSSSNNDASSAAYYSSNDDGNNFNDDATSDTNDDDGSSSSNQGGVGYNQYNSWYYNSNSNNKNNNANGYNYGYNYGYNSGSYNYNYNPYNYNGGSNANNYYGNRRNLEDATSSTSSSNVCPDGYHPRKKQYPWYIDSSTGKCAFTKVCQDYQTICRAYDPDSSSSSSSNTLLTCQGYKVGSSYTYLGPHCQSDGRTIGIGIYSDSQCNSYVADSSEIMSYSANYNSAFDDTLSINWANYNDKSCISCDYENSFALVNNSVASSGTVVNPMCANLYNVSAKCNKHLSSNSNIKASSDERNICKYIDSLRNNQLDDAGDYVLPLSLSNLDWTSRRTYAAIINEVTLSQIIILLIMIVSTISLSMYTCFLRKKLLHRKPWVPPTKVFSGAIGVTSGNRKNNHNDEPQCEKESNGTILDAGHQMSRVHSGIVLVRTDSMGESVGPLSIAAAGAMVGTPVTPYVPYGGEIPQKKSSSMFTTSQRENNNKQKQLPPLPPQPPQTSGGSFDSLIHASSSSYESPIIQDQAQYLESLENASSNAKKNTSNFASILF